MFVTCLFAVINPETGLARFANAGHNLPFQCNAQGAAELHATGMPLGLLPGMVYEENETVLAEGDSLVMYSDGLTEAHNPHREMFDTARLQSQLEVKASGKGLIDSLLSNLAEFTGPGWEQEDDITCVILDRSAQIEG
jgi:serine phosphatase RsbU (regulator of sigma subunit)